MFIDTHAHIYSKEFGGLTEEIIKNALNNNVSKILMPAIDSESHDAMFKIEDDYPEICKSMIGLHPCSVTESYENELAIIKKHLDEKNCIAIGETGLDFYWDETYKAQQYQALEQQILWALEYNLPIVIHSRNATDECIEILKKYATQGLTGVFHCFGGTLEQAQQITEMGFYLGIGGVLTFKNSSLATVLSAISLDNIVLETDAPYLAPVPFRGKRNEPSYIPIIAEKLAFIKNMNLETVAQVTTDNAEKLFKLK